MRAARLMGHGGPEQLVLGDDVARPVPSPTEALIAVAACGINNTDINTRIGWYGSSVTGATLEVATADVVDNVGWSGALQFPRIQGADICGTVIEVGSPQHSQLLGRRVLIDPWIRVSTDPTDPAAAGYVGSECDGGFAEFVCVPVANIHPVDSPLGDVELASFPCSGATALNMLQRIRLSAAETVVITGASGGVGSFAVQLAARQGARVIAIASQEKANGVLGLGADVVIPRDSSDLAAAIADVVGGPVDAVMDVVGGAAQFTALISALRPRGRYVAAGAIGGPIVPLDLRTLYLKDLELHGVTSFAPELFSDLVRIIERDELRPVVGAVFPLGEIHAAQAFFAAKAHIGSVVLSVE